MYFRVDEKETQPTHVLREPVSCSGRNERLLQVAVFVPFLYRNTFTFLEAEFMHLLSIFVIPENNASSVHDVGSGALLTVGLPDG